VFLRAGILAAVEAAKAVTDRPSIIKVSTTIGFGSKKEGTEAVRTPPPTHTQPRCAWFPVRPPAVTEPSSALEGGGANADACGLYCDAVVHVTTGCAHVACAPSPTHSRKCVRVWGACALMFCWWAAWWGMRCPPPPLPCVLVVQVHGAPLGADDIAQLKSKLGFDATKSFFVPEEVLPAVRRRCCCRQQLGGGLTCVAAE
jgi:hypothetical protein